MIVNSWAVQIFTRVLRRFPGGRFPVRGSEAVLGIAVIPDRASRSRRRRHDALPNGAAGAPVQPGHSELRKEDVTQLLSLDPGREARRVTEEAADRVRDKFGPGVIGPAGAFLRVS